MSQVLAGRRVLVVEDEALVSMLLEAILGDMGCVPVGPATSVEEGLALAICAQNLDAALLDVHVVGGQVFPVAQILRDRGIPFVFSTGSAPGDLPEEWRGYPTVQKPFTEADLLEALMATIGIERA